MENNYLNEIAKSVKEDHENGIPITEITPQAIPQAIPIEQPKEEAVESEPIEHPAHDIVEEDEDDECVVILPTNQAAMTTNSQMAVSDGTEIVSIEDAKQHMKDMPDEVFKEKYTQLNSDIYNYKKDLMINQGFTSEEADKAAQNRFKRTADSINTDYIQNNPKLGVIEINKKDEENIILTDEEHDKLQKVKAIKLVVVENQNLEVLNIKKDIKEEHIGKYIREINGSLCHYTIPLPIYGDMVTFNGAQTMQLVSVVARDDDEISEVLERKASLIYDRINYGNIFNKYDQNGNVIMSYNDFINQFMYQDVDIALYAIIVASSMEYSETDLKCSDKNCGTQFKQKYNMKKLLQPDMLDYFKERFETILSNRNASDVMNNLHEEISKATRVKSTFTGNVYDMEFPTLGKAIDHYKSLDATDTQAVYNSTIGLYINTLYIYDSTDDSYIPIKGKDILSVFSSIPQLDIELLTNYIEKHMAFIPKFKLTSKCTKCGKEMVNELDIDQMVFLRAQDSSTQIE